MNKLRTSIFVVHFKPSLAQSPEQVLLMASFYFYKARSYPTGASRWSIIP